MVVVVAEVAVAATKMKGIGRVGTNANGVRVGVAAETAIGIEIVGGSNI